MKIVKTMRVTPVTQALIGKPEGQFPVPATTVQRLITVIYNLHGNIINHKRGFVE